MGGYALPKKRSVRNSNSTSINIADNEVKNLSIKNKLKKKDK